MSCLNQFQRIHVDNSFPNSIIYAAGLAKLYQGKDDNWTEKQTGVVVLLYDEQLQSNFFKLLSFDDNSVNWSEELYIGIKYENPKTWFHTFETQECIWGISFSSSREGDIFYQEVISCSSDSHLVTSVSLEEAKKSESKPPERITAIGPIQEINSDTYNKNEKELKIQDIKETRESSINTSKNSARDKDKKWTLRRGKRESKNISQPPITINTGSNNITPNNNIPPPNLPPPNIPMPPPPHTSSLLDLAPPTNLPPPPPVNFLSPPTNLPPPPPINNNF
eukprot:TRINITY_DN5693_c0_g1_i1.p1 TRINITY_DN5693_c0_g1~~TRINITY_DN5693_c0_g1_i1.p1  ORF type:complete len:279 (+),score=98.01 TRINITY_DN5693_c0_g1_i1:2-838(+)